MSGDLFIAPDGYGDLTLWRHNQSAPDRPSALVRRCDVLPTVWDLILKGAGLT